MKYYPLYLLDDIGNEHPRKNLYLKELAELQDALKKARGSERAALQEKLRRHRQDREKHPYMLAFRDFKEKEKSFRRELKHKKSAFKQSSSERDPELRRLEIMKRTAEAERDFYEPYAELTHDASMAYRAALIKLRHIPGMLEHLKDLDARILETRHALINAEREDRSAVLAEIKSKSEERRTASRKKRSDLKDKLREHVISAKALHNETRVEKHALKEDLACIKLLDPVRRLKDELRSLKHHRRIDPSDMRDVLQADLSDLRRKTPTEPMYKNVRNAWIGLWIPGLSQLLNKQYLKALLFFLGTLFVAFVALPYALGYGNYQGQGVAGLITLAKGGRRVDRSMIFLIEGIVALMFVLLSAALYYFHIRDSFSVERKKLRGIRPYNAYESKKMISENGFPYLVSVPSMVVILFIVLVPVITTILLSFTNMDPKHQSKFIWVGMNNYQTLALGQGVAGKAFWLILGWTLIWTLCATSLAIFIGFVLSLVVNQDRIRAKKLWRTIYLLPWAVPAFISIMFFSIMLAPNGPLTEILSTIAGTTINVKNDTVLTRTALILLQGWLGSSYIFLLCTGILQSIPSDLYEAAEIDGATGLQRTLHITIPLVLFQIAPLLVTQYTFNFNNYSIIALFNDGGPFFPSQYGNLAGSSDILISYIFKLTIKNQYQALGAAITIIVSLVLMLVAFLGFRKTKAFSKEA